MIKRELIFRNTCEKCGNIWHSDVGEEAKGICPACCGDEQVGEWSKELKEVKTLNEKNKGGVEKALEELKRVENIIDFLKATKEENPH